MPIVKNICTVVCTILFICPALTACHISQGLQSLDTTDNTNSETQESHIVWDLSPNAQFTYNTLLFNLAAAKNDVNLGIEAIASIEMLIEQHNIVPDVIWYNEASTFLFTNDEKELAQIMLHKGIERYPDDIKLTLLYAEASSSLQKYNDAIAILEDFHTKNPQNKEIRFELIKAHIRHKQFAEAEEIFKSIPSREFTPLLHYYYAKTAMGLQNMELAKKHFAKTIEMEPTFTEAYAELAYLYEMQKDFANAERIYKGLMDLEASNIELWIRIMNMNIMLDNPKNAYAMAMKGVAALDEKTPHQSMDFMLRAARVFLDAKYFSQAQDMLHAMTQRENTPQEAYFLLGAIAYEQFKKPIEALKHLELIDITSDYHKRALQLQAQIQYELGQRKTALDIVEEALILYPDYKVFHDMHVQIYINAKQYNKALTIIDNALTIWPEEGDFHSRRGSILEMLGRSDEAFASMKKAITYSQKNSAALNYVAYSMAEKNENLDQALEYAQQAIALEPKNGHIMDTLAWVQYKLGHMAEALKVIKKALQLGADEPEIWEHYGDIALANGDVKTARQAYTKAISKEPKNVAELRAKLGKL